MSEDEVESFEITDYDLDNEFNTARPRRKLSKKQQMLGIWADDSDKDELSARPSFKTFNKGPKNYTAPVNFVAGGIQQAGKPKEKEDEDDEEYKEEREAKHSSSSSEDERPNSSKSRTSFSLNLDSDIVGLRKKRNQVNPMLMKSGMGSWEVHTKGIGAKLLLQMEFEPGKGLGKQLQGISAPVEAHLRKGRGAIGAYGPEKKIPEKKKDDGEVSQWRKSDSNKKKVRYCYRSVDQVLENGKLKPNRKLPVSSDMSRVKVIDMTGPEQRILSGYHAISSDKKSKINFALHELQHNLDVLVDMCEQNIIQNDQRKEILHGGEALWMSPDGHMMLYSSFNDSLVEGMHISWFGEGNKAIYPDIRSLRYPKPETPNPSVRLYVADLVDPKNIRTKIVKPPPIIEHTDRYFSTASWTSLTEVCITWLTRAQNFSVITICKSPMWHCQEIQRISGEVAWVDTPPEPPLFSVNGSSYIAISPVKDGPTGYYKHIIWTNVLRKQTVPLTHGKFEVVRILVWDQTNNTM
ncbi:PREDICTED: septin-interacting protein 1-like isoform X2 [Vollenhovia emeryi]|uniref:septin-interacting protein 1-like isoform X2 n=1 Tax=Vollenhovia emeryi TaxID=411798 RepID=UPI0005F37A14|nr:PREDICTED: septin-interacting protein 1-like isoform X2 [Vollenhovia emeryi]